MVKKRLYIFIIVVFMLLIGGCGNNKYKNGVSEDQMILDFQSNNSFLNESFTITSADIIKRQTNYDEKTDLIYLQICANNKYFKVTKSFKLEYVLYNDGWILENISDYDNEGDSDFEVIYYPTTEEMKADIERLCDSDSMKIDNFYLQEDCKLEQISEMNNELYSEWYYTYQYEYFRHEINLRLSYYRNDRLELVPHVETIGSEFFYNDNIVGDYTVCYSVDGDFYKAKLCLSMESPKQIRVIKSVDNNEYDCVDYLCDIRPVDSCFEEDLFHPIKLQLGPFYNTYAVTIEPDGLYYYCVSKNEYYKLSRDGEELIDDDAEEVKYVNKVFEEVNSYLSEGLIEDAEKCVIKALNVYPGNEALIQLYSDVTEHYPISIDSFLETNGFKEEEDAPFYSAYEGQYDSYGNYYPDAKVYWTSSVYSKIGEVKCNTYVLNGEYKHFNAVLMIHGDWKYASSNPGTTFYVIGDDEELFSTYVSNDSDSIYIDIDITGINKLKIGMDGGKYAYLYLGNAVVYKQYGSIEE